MIRITVSWLLIFLFLQPIDALEKTKGKKTPTRRKKITLLIGIPVDAASTPKIKDEWFKGLAEQYLHFRIGASNNVNVISSEKVFQITQGDPTKARSVSKIAKTLSATHSLQQNYEISGNGKDIHFYAELTSHSEKGTIASFERDFAFEEFQAAMDSCVKWIFNTTNTELNLELLNRFYSLKIISTNFKDMKAIGTIINRKYKATMQEIMTSIKSLVLMVEQNPHNILAQYVTAQLYEFFSLYQEANKQLQDLLVIIPNYAALYADVSRNLRLSGKYEEALSYAAHGEKKGIVTNALMLEGALSLEAMGKYAKAEKAFKIINAKDKDEINALLFFTRHNNRNNKSQEAIKYANKIINLDPQNGQAYLEKGKAFRHLGKLKKAEDAWTKSAGLLKNGTEPTCFIGDIYLKAKDFSKAGVFYEAALKLDKPDYDLYLKTISIWEKTNNYTSTLKILKDAEKHFSDSLIIHKKLGIYYYLTGDTSNGIMHAEKYLEKNGKDTQVLMMLGDIYTAQGNYDKAFYMYNHALPLMTDKKKVSFSLALLYLKKGDTGAAISLLKKVLKKKPDYPQAQRFFADAWYIEENYNAALIEYKKARFFDKKDPYIQKRIALIYFKLNQYNAASREFIQYFNYVKDDVEAYYCIAIAQFHLHWVEKAEENLKKALKLGDPDSPTLYRIGISYRDIKKPKQAIKYLKQCLTLDSGHEEALLALAEIYLDEKRPVLAAQTYLKLYKVNASQYSRFLAKAGMLYEEVKDDREAAKAYREFVDKGFTNFDVNIRLARLDYKEKNYTSIIDLFAKVPKDQIREESDRMILAESYAKTNQPAHAIPWLKKVLHKDEKNKSALIMLAAAYETVNDYQNGVLIYKKLYKIDQTNKRSNYTYKIGVFNEKLHKKDVAITIYLKNIEEFPEDIRNYDNVTKIYIGFENWSAAREILEKSVLLTHSKPSHRKQLAEICLQQNDRSNAVNNYKRYLDLNPKDHEVWFKLGNLYFERKLYNKALGYYKRADKLNPNNFAIIFQSAQAFFKSREFDKAIHFFEKLQNMDSTHIEILSYLRQVYRIRQKTPKLITILRKLARLQPENYEVHYELGSTLLKEGKTEPAIAVLETASKMTKEDSKVHLLLAQIYISLGNENAQFSHLKQALAMNPNDADAHAQIGRFHLEKQQDETAMQHLTRALTINPDHLGALHSYSQYLFQQGDFEKALNHIKQVVSNNSFDPLVLTLYAKINHALKNYKLAISNIEDALMIDSTNVEILNWAGFFYKESGKNKKAKKLLMKAISISENCWKCNNNMGEIFFDETNYAKATGFFRKALKIKPDDEKIMMKLGRALVLSYDNASAKQIFKSILAINPKHHEAFYRLAHIYNLEKNQQKVNELIDNRKVDKKTVWDHLVKGEYYESQGNIEAAAISFKVALRLHPNLAEAHYGYGRIDLLNKRFSQAIVSFSKALVKDPFNPYLLLNLGKAYAGIGQISSAYDVYKEVSEKYPLIPDSYCLIANIKSHQKEHRDAIEIIEKGLKNSLQDADLFATLGRENRFIGKFDKAIDSYKNAIKKGGADHLDLYLKIAAIYNDDLKNENEAKKILKKYLKKGGSPEKMKKSSLTVVEIKSLNNLLAD